MHQNSLTLLWEVAWGFFDFSTVNSREEAKKKNTKPTNSTFSLLFEEKWKISFEANKPPAFYFMFTLTQRHHSLNRDYHHLIAKETEMFERKCIFVGSETSQDIYFSLHGFEIILRFFLCIWHNLKGSKTFFFFYIYISYTQGVVTVPCLYTASMKRQKNLSNFLLLSGIYFN